MSNNYQIQNALFSLGFYSGPTDGNLASKACKKSIKNFQIVYGIKANGKMNSSTKSKLSEAYTMKSRIMSSTAIRNIDKKIDDYTFDYTPKDTFANTWTFLRISMGLTKKQAAGVCGNILNESVFAADNVEDEYMKGVHNKDYKYSTGDGIGYGLIQWTFSSRKKGLL